MKTAVSIGTRIEMFVDDWLIERKDESLTLRLHQPERKETVLEPNLPWEGPNCGYYTVIQHEEIIRLYYRGNCYGADNDASQVTCYAESTDGIRFHRPELGLYEYEGSSRNNILWRGVESHNFTPFLDVSPSAGASERFKAVGGVGDAQATTNQSALYALASADGIRWRLLQEEPIMTNGGFDSQNIAFWDSAAKKYRCYNRYFSETELRAIQSAESSEFLQWGPQRRNEYTDGPQEEQYYTNTTMPCPGAEHMLFSFPMRFFPERKVVAEHEYEGVSDTVFMTSRDGVHWDRTFREAWLRPGRDPRNWTDRNGAIASGIVELPGEPDQWSFYATEHYRWDSARLRRVAVRKYGLASVHAGVRPGTFTTRPLRFEGNRLLLNFATSAAGSIRAELTDASGNPIDGYRLDDMDPMYGDELDGIVRWRGGADIGPWAGREIFLRFELKDADLYALRTSSIE